MLLRIEQGFNEILSIEIKAVSLNNGESNPLPGWVKGAAYKLVEYFIDKFWSPCEILVAKPNQNIQNVNVIDNDF